MPGATDDEAVSGWAWINEAGLEVGGSFTFARGASPARVMEAFGMNPANAILAPLSWETRGLLPYPDEQAYPPEHPWIRVGTTGIWGFALDESSGGFGGYEEEAADALSADTEAVLLTHTATIDVFHYYSDGTEVTAFEPLRPWDRWGTDPDRFLPQMQAAGLRLDGDDDIGDAVIAVLEMLTLAFGIRLPRDVALGPLLTVQRD